VAHQQEACGASSKDIWEDEQVLEFLQTGQHQQGADREQGAEWRTERNCTAEVRVSCGAGCLVAAWSWCPKPGGGVLKGDWHISITACEVAEKGCGHGVQWRRVNYLGAPARPRYFKWVYADGSEEQGLTYYKVTKGKEYRLVEEGVEPPPGVWVPAFKPVPVV